MDEEPELFSGDPGLDLDDGELLTGELAVEDFVDDDVDAILVDCDFSTLDSLLSNLSDNLGVGDFESAGDFLAGERCSGVILLDEGLAGEEEHLSPPPLEELLSRAHSVVSGSNSR